MLPLAGRVALVTGASRGIGRGIAEGLDEAGATVIVTGRTVTRGSVGVAIACDHRDDDAVAELFASIERDYGRLDVLVNNATMLPEFKLLFSAAPFWELEPEVWDGLFDVGLRSHYVAAQHAARLMIPRSEGLIVNVSSAGAVSKFAVLPYGVAKAALDRMTVDMAAELHVHGVTVVSLWPPPTATESMLANVEPDDDPSTWSSPIFNGRVVAALAADPDVSARTGGALVARTVAAELGIDDPRP